MIRGPQGRDGPFLLQKRRPPRPGLAVDSDDTIRDNDISDNKTSSTSLEASPCGCCVRAPMVADSAAVPDRRITSEDIGDDRASDDHICDECIV